MNNPTPIFPPPSLLTPPEFSARYHVRRPDGIRSCTGCHRSDGEPCIHSACIGYGASPWVCKHPAVCSWQNVHAFPLPDPDHTVCDAHTPYALERFPSYGPSSSCVG